MNSIDEAFSSVKQYCRKEGRISEAAMKLWIDIMKPVQLDGSVAVFTVQSEFQKTVVMNTYNALLKEAFLNVLGLDVKIQINVVTPEENDNPLSENSNAKDYDELARRHEELEHSFEGANYEYTFATFIVGGSNEFAYAACTAVAKEPGKNYNPLFIYGPSGLGKTHLMHAIANQVHENHPEYKIIYVTSEEFGNDFLSCINDNNMARFHDKYRNADVLLIDDVQMLSGKTQMQVEFFNVFNMLYNQHKQIVLTSDRQPCEIADLDKRLETRFEQGMTAEVCPPEYEARLSILRMMRSETLVQSILDDSLLEFLAANIASNVRRLRGAFIRLASYASFSGKGKLEISQAEELLQSQLAQESSARDISIESIQRTVASHFGVTMTDILSEKRNRGIAEPRMIAMFLCRELTKSSSNEVGSAFGRNHATVLHAEKKVQQLCEANEGVRRAISQIKRQLQRG